MRSYPIDLRGGAVRITPALAEIIVKRAQEHAIDERLEDDAPGMFRALMDAQAAIRRESALARLRGPMRRSRCADLRGVHIVRCPKPRHWRK
jgi:hypothetical protein